VVFDLLQPFLCAKCVASSGKCGRSRETGEEFARLEAEKASMMVSKEVGSSWLLRPGQATYIAGDSLGQ
jgi:hypothetical protein